MNNFNESQEQIYAPKEEKEEKEWVYKYVLDSGPVLLVHITRDEKVPLSTSRVSSLQFLVRDLDRCENVLLKSKRKITRPTLEQSMEESQEDLNQESNQEESKQSWIKTVVAGIEFVFLKKTNIVDY